MKQSMDEKLREAFACHAQIPEETEARLALCYERVRSAEKGISMKRENSKPKRKALRTALALAAVICVMAGAALAVADYTGFFESAFGDGIAAQPAHDVEVVDADGNLVTTEHYPAIDRAPVDTEQADALLGDYVSAVGQSVTVRGYTFTVRECVMDENGIGAVTVDVENPSGISRQTVFDGAAGEMAPYNIVFRQGAAGGFDDRGFIEEDAGSDTCVRWVYYLIAMDAPEGDITVEFHVRNEDSDGEKAPLYETAELTIAQDEFVPAARFTGGNFEAELSPVGLLLRVTDVEADGVVDLNTKELVIRYVDGSEYVVEGEDVFSSSVALLRDGSEVCLSLNRLVDVASVAEICLRGYYYEPIVVDVDGAAEAVEAPADTIQIAEPAAIDFDLTLTRE